MIWYYVCIYIYIYKPRNQLNTMFCKLAYQFVQNLMFTFAFTSSCALLYIFWWNILMSKIQVKWQQVCKQWECDNFTGKLFFMNFNCFAYQNFFVHDFGDLVHHIHHSSQKWQLLHKNKHFWSSLLCVFFSNDFYILTFHFVRKTVVTERSH